jgi:hypothetical protein
MHRKERTLQEILPEEIPDEDISVVVSEWALLGGNATLRKETFYPYRIRNNEIIYITGTANLTEAGLLTPLVLVVSACFWDKDNNAVARYSRGKDGIKKG